MVITDDVSLKVFMEHLIRRLQGLFKDPPVRNIRLRRASGNLEGYKGFRRLRGAGEQQGAAVQTDLGSPGRRSADPC